MLYEEARAIVDRAAELLPEPPDIEDSEAYGWWEALTLDTCRRLARVLRADTDLIKALTNDERRKSAAWRRRRRLLSRVTLLAATQLTASEPPRAAFRCTRLADGTIVVTPAGEAGRSQAPRPGWAAAA
jgi:hypothetical protein